MITEADYQRVYLKNKPSHRTYRDALNLALSANAGSFLGIGLEEDDLLRPLRQFVSERQQALPERPLFALYHRIRGRENEAEYKRRWYYARYGLKMCFYDLDNERDVGNRENHTKALCRKLDEISDCWTEWWLGWQMKPSVRQPDFRVAHSVAYQTA